MNEWRFGAILPRGFEQVKGAQRIHFEIEKRDGRGLIVRGLGGGMDNQVGPQLSEQREDAGAVADIERFMAIAGDFAAQAIEHPTGISFGTEEDGAMVAVDTDNVKSLAGEKDRDLGANQATRAGYQYGWSGHSS